MHDWVEVASDGLAGIVRKAEEAAGIGLRLTKRKTGARTVKRDAREAVMMVALRRKACHPMNPAQKAIWFIETHLAEGLTLEEVSDVAGVSRFHMVRAFAAATGLSVMRYARARAPVRGGAGAGGRRAGYPQRGAGCGLRLSRSIHPRLSRSFRRDARSGPEPRALRPSQTPGADPHGLKRTRQTSAAAVCYRQAVSRRRARRTLHLRKQRRRNSRPVASLPSSGRRLPGPGREGGLRRLLQRR